jgi:hypothetical protein
MIGFLLSPVGRIISAIGGVLLAIATVYGKGRRDARQKMEAEANADALNRTQAAIRAGDSAAVDSTRLRDNDGHRRD